MAKGTIYVPVAGDGEAPQSYTVPGTSVLDLEAVRADFDGSGVASDFLPAVRILDSSGNIMAQVVGETVAAGDFASVTFAPFLNQASAGGGGSGTLTHASMWFDVGLFGDGFITIPNNANTDVSFAHVYADPGSPFSFQSVVNPNDTLSLDSADHIYLITSSALWNLIGFVQYTILSTPAPTVVSGQLFGNISLHSLHPDDYFNITSPSAGSAEGSADYMIVRPQTAGQKVTLQAYQQSGVSKDLRRGVIAALAFPLA